MAKAVGTDVSEGVPGKAGIISAGALEKYGYCPLSWWLSRDEKEEDLDRVPLARGERAHEDASTDLRGIVKGERLAKEFETVVLWFAIAATLISVMGLSLGLRAEPDVGQIMGVIALIWILAACYFLYKSETISQKKFSMLYQRIILIFAIVAVIIALNSVILLSRFDNPDLIKILQAISLAWLIGACYFLYHSLTHFQRATYKRQKRAVKHELVYVDSEEKRPKLFVSERYGLSGRPDYVLFVGEHHIPVELKTGRVPKGPLFSHILQVAAYCMLVEEEFGAAPPHGIIRYGDVEYEIEYNDSLEELVLTKLREMRSLTSTGQVHRNHNKPGKCRYCSRRAACPERLA